MQSQWVWCRRTVVESLRRWERESESESGSECAACVWGDEGTIVVICGNTVAILSTRWDTLRIDKHAPIRQKRFCCNRAQHCELIRITHMLAVNSLNDRLCALTHCRCCNIQANQCVGGRMTPCLYRINDCSFLSSRLLGDIKFVQLRLQELQAQCC